VPGVRQHVASSDGTVREFLLDFDAKDLLRTLGGTQGSP
jgi:hypothetical protein